MVKINKAKTIKYSPVRVVNPLSDNHLVHLHPNQGFMVMISAWVGLVDVDYNSDFFDLSEEEKLRDGTRIFHFSQKYDLTQWYKAGSVYLGEVVLVGAQTCSSLCVSLESKKTDLFTVINPFGTELKIHPHQILEVVLYDKIFNGKWTCALQPGENGVMYRQVGYESICTSIEIHTLVEKLKTADNFIVFPRALDYEGMEHHYWFEYDVPSIKQITKWRTGTYHGGRLIFSPGISTTDPPERNILHVNLSVRGKNRSKLVLPKRLPDSAPFDTVLDVDNDYALQDDDDDIIIGHVPGGASINGSPSPSRSGYGVNKYYSNNNKQYNLNVKPMVRNAEIQEKTIKEEDDPLFLGATTVQHTEDTYKLEQNKAMNGIGTHISHGGIRSRAQL